MEMIDTHCHLDMPAFDPDRAQVLQNARAGGVRGIVVPGVTAAGWAGLRALCESEPDLYPAYGLHPVYLGAHRSDDAAMLREYLGQAGTVAVGEIGLDFYVEDPDRQRQQSLFETQLELAREAGLPVILHVRKAHDQVLATLGRIRVPGGIAHAFNGSRQQADRYIDLGFKLGFGGMLTYERSSKLRALAAGLPAESLVLETDAPDLTVSRHRGERNSPEYLPDCLAALAQVREQTAQELARQTTANARAVLRLEG
jgi:TatD DNase family protein